MTQEVYCKHGTSVHGSVLANHVGMQKTKRTKSSPVKTRKSWGRWPVNLQGIRISTQLSEALDNEINTSQHTRASIVREALELRYGTSTAKPAMQSDAQTA